MAMKRFSVSVLSLLLALSLLGACACVQAEGAAADGTLLKLNGKDVEDPAAADAGAWEPIRFE